MYRHREMGFPRLALSIWGVLSGCAGPNTPPEVSVVTAWPSVVAVGESSMVTVSTRDSDGDTLRYHWSSSCAGTWADASFASARFTPTAQPAADGLSCASCALTVDVTDGQGGRATGSLSLCVRSHSVAGSTPKITETFQSSNRVPENGFVSFEIKAADPRNSALTFTWTSNVGELSELRSQGAASQVHWKRSELLPTDPNVTPAITATVTNAVGLSTQAVFLLTRAPLGTLPN
ncbi:hypothetical protein [Melittangium boletus]|uniref:Uncharacterized protein n=1 Tax=Melittangium boletus DSM 14713 TaxID=1294270 RepID=A0A250IQ39_9BACT|nr:hypothetical protein [Melittangium boletus]ATB33869.1 hypothetical protein MEBOL_007370 [Melittangium boletus DSM 14713]